MCTSVSGASTARCPPPGLLFVPAQILREELGGVLEDNFSSVSAIQPEAGWQVSFALDQGVVSARLNGRELEVATRGHDSAEYETPYTQTLAGSLMENEDLLLNAFEDAASALFADAQ